MPGGYDPIRDMGPGPGASTAPPRPTRSHHPPSPGYEEERARHRRALAADGSGARLPHGARADETGNPAKEDYHLTHEGRYQAAAEDADRYQGAYPPQAGYPAQMAHQARASPLHHQHYHQQQSAHSPHHPQLQHRPSSSSSNHSLPFGVEPQRQQETRRSASIHDLIAASEIMSAGQPSSAAAPHASPHSARGLPPTRSLSHQGDEHLEQHYPLHRPGSSMSRSVSGSSQPGLPQRQSSQSQLFAAPAARTERSPSMANLLNDGTAGAVRDRPRSGSQSSISSMLSHSHSHPQLPANAHGQPHGQHAQTQHTMAAASAPPAPQSTYSASQHGHQDLSGRDLQQRPGSSTSASWRSPVMGGPMVPPGARTNSSPALGPAQLGVAGSGPDRQRIFSHPGLVGSHSHPRSLSASHGHVTGTSVGSSPSGAPLPALHASPSHQFAVPELPSHRSPESRRIPLPLSPSSGPMIPGRGPTTPGSAWHPSHGPVGPSYAGPEDAHAQVASSPRRTPSIYTNISRFQQPPTPGAGVPLTPGSLPPTPGGLMPMTPGSRSHPANTPGFDPRYAEEYFPKRHSDAAEAYAQQAAGRHHAQQSPAAGSQRGDDEAYAEHVRRSSITSRHEQAGTQRGSQSYAQRDVVAAEATRGHGVPPPLPAAASSPTSNAVRPDRIEEPEPSPRGAIFDPVRGIVAIPASRRTSNTSSKQDEASPPLDPRRFSESSAGARSSFSANSVSARRASMDVRGPIMSSPDAHESIGKRRISYAPSELEAEIEPEVKRQRLSKQVAEDEAIARAGPASAVDPGTGRGTGDAEDLSPKTVAEPKLKAVPDAGAGQEPNGALEPTSASKVEPEPKRELDPEEAQKDESKEAPVPRPKPVPTSQPPKTEVTSSPPSSKSPERPADVEMEPAKRPSPPRFTPPADEELRSNGQRQSVEKDLAGLTAKRERRPSPSDDRTPPPTSPVPTASKAPSAAAAPPPRYAPKKRVSPPKTVMRPIGIDEIDDKRRRCRNPLRMEWERQHQADSREPLDNLLREYHETQQAARASSSASGAGAPDPGRAELKRAREDDLKDALEVADHYNKRREVGIHGREESPIIALRKFNNWVKSVLIGRFTRGRDPHLDGRGRARGGRVMELGCGKGGDLKKWDKVNPASLVGVDIAQVSIEQAMQRHRDNGSRFEAHFYAFDCFSRPLTEVVPRELVEPGIDTVSLQFCMHYAWENPDKARQMLDNVSRYLRIGGTFIGTIPDCDVLRRRLYYADSPTFGNQHYRITFDSRTSNAAFGDRYTFFLQDAVENVPEYVVDWPTFETLAAEVGLRCIYSRNFAEIYNDDGRGGRRNGSEFGALAERMRVVDSARGELSMDDDMWAAVTLYKGFAFEKFR